MLLEKKTAIITGSNKGIGLEILKLFSSNGADIIACSRKCENEFLDKLDSYKEKFKNKIIPIKLDFSDEENVKEAANEILSLKNNIDILVNNASSIHTSLFQMTTKKKFMEIFNVNLFSQSVFTQFILKSMIKNKSGNIIYISSSSAQDANVGRSAYASSKAAVNTQAKVLSKELGKLNIRVNTIAPGLTDTDMMRNNTTDEVINNALQQISLGRIAKPNEIASVALFLASNLSSYVTGQIIRVDGGM